MEFIQTFSNFTPEALQQKFCFKIYRDEGHYVGSIMHESSSKTKKWGAVADDLANAARASLQQAIQEGLKRAKRRAKMAKDLYKAFPDEPAERIEDTVDHVNEGHLQALYLRRKRFKRKAFLNDWNYFVTVTRDDEKWENEEDFRASVDKCLSNLSTRRDWRQMGVWELGDEKERLHYHCLLKVPEGQMVGDLYAKRDYSTKRHQWEETQLNSFFTDHFGRTEFQDLDQTRLLESVSYILKYLEKSGEKIRYSRGIPTEICLPMCLLDEAALEYEDGNQVKVVFMDDAKSWKTIIARFKPSFIDRIREFLMKFGSIPVWLENLAAV